MNWFDKLKSGIRTLSKQPGTSTRHSRLGYQNSFNPGRKSTSHTTVVTMPKSVSAACIKRSATSSNGTLRRRSYIDTADCVVPARRANSV